MPIIVTAYRIGRVPEAEEKMVLGVMKRLDTPDQLVQVPWHIRLNGVDFWVKWHDAPQPHAPDDTFDAFYENGRCAKCGKLEGDHLHPWFSTTPSGACRFTPKLSRSELLRARINVSVA